MMMPQELRDRLAVQSRVSSGEIFYEKEREEFFPFLSVVLEFLQDYQQKDSA
jgi:hypothetical protein